MNINQYLTKVNYNTLTNKINKYIVIHYTANNGDTALGNCKYFYSENRGSSANYFVDENSIYQCVEDKDVAWHCGANKYKHRECRNSNSIGIELCSRKDGNGNYFFMNDTVSNAIELTKMLMSKYNISIDNVLRHYDVTGKNCPEPLVRNIKIWQEFKNRLVNKEEDDEVVSEGKVKVNGKEYKVDRILKDNANFVKLTNFNNMGFDVGYDAETKIASINNEISNINVNDKEVEAVNFNGYNFVKLRDLAEVLGKSIEIIDGKIKIL